MNKKFLLVALAAIILIAGAATYFAFSKKVKSQQSAVLKLSSSTDRPAVGAPFTIVLSYANAKPDAVSFDAVVNYDPEVLRIDDIKTKGIFAFYPRKLIEDYKNRFVITGANFDLKNEIPPASGVLAEITVVPLRVGRTKLEFLTDRDQTTVVNKLAKNVLERAEGLELEIK